MSKLKRSAVAALLATAAVAGTTVATATPASASSIAWLCKTSTKTIDTPNYSGYSDDWDFTVKNCSGKYGGYLYAKASIKWDAPWAFKGNNTFGGAYGSDAFLRLNIKHPDDGADTVLARKDLDIEYKLEHGDQDTYLTVYTKKYVGSKSAYADSTLNLNWNNDGAWFKHYGFAKAPTL